MMKRCPKCGITKSIKSGYYKQTGWCKECKKEYGAKRYAPIKANVRAKRLAQYKNGRKQCKKCKRWLDPSDFGKHHTSWDRLKHKCRECNSKTAKQRYYKNQEKHLEDGRKWYRENREKKLANDKKWRRENPEKSRAIWHRYKSRKLAADGDFTPEQWKAIKAYYCPDGKCLSCTNKRPLTIDHIVPLIKGGSNYIANIQPICQSCNSAKGDERIIDYRPDQGLFNKELMNES